MTGLHIAAVLLFAPLVAVGEVIEGTVTAQRSPLPGCTITLTSASESRMTVTNEHGRFSFRYVPAGRYELTIELAGFRSALRQIEVRGHTVVPPVELVVLDMHTVTIVNCTLGRTCSDQPPSSPWHLPWCPEQRLNDSLIAAIANDDRSAIALLQRQYEKSETHREKNRLGAALLGKVPDDRAIRNALLEQASIAMRYPLIDGKYPAAFEEYCRERNLDPNLVWHISSDALRLVRRAARVNAPR